MYILMPISILSRPNRLLVDEATSDDNSGKIGFLVFGSSRLLLMTRLAQLQLLTPPQWRLFNCSVATLSSLGMHAYPVCEMEGCFYMLILSHLY